MTDRVGVNRLSPVKDRIICDQPTDFCKIADHVTTRTLVAGKLVNHDDSGQAPQIQ